MEEEFVEEEVRKICPFRINNTPPISSNKCVKDNCAWWCDFSQDCAVPLLAGMFADSSICRAGLGSVIP